MPFTLLTGGARSGKSSLAVRIAMAWKGPVTVIVTGEAGDEEMAARIERHRAARPRQWNTVEEPVEIGEAIEAAPPNALLIVDCLTLWVANLMERGAVEADVSQRAAAVAKSAASRAGPAVVVTNEVGAGLVPMSPYGRSYRDLMGTVNAAFAEHADHAYLVVAGRALALSSAEEVTGHVLDT